MAGATPTTALGVGFTTTKYGPRVTVRPSVLRTSYYVCHRETGETWTEIIAECKTRDMAIAAAKALRKELP